MKFIEITVHTSSEGSELVADILWRYTTYGVAICDLKDIIALQENKATYWDYIDDEILSGGEETLVKCFIPTDEVLSVAPKIRADLEELKINGCGELPLGTLEDTRREVDGDDWLQIWKMHFRPIRLGKIVVCPEWIEYTPQEGERIVKLDSNMAFGTGEHETTAMCVKLIQEYLNENDVCIDVGCGSGILGISALKLGASRAYLTDIDYVAVESAKHNCEQNDVADMAIVAHADLLENTDIKGDIIFANITAEILCMLAPSIPKNLKTGGTLILSGIIESRLKMVCDAFCAQGLKIDREVREGEWYALAFTR